MSNRQVRALVAKRERVRRMLKSVDAELSVALGVWSDDHGFLMKLTPEQALRSMGNINA